MLVFAAFESFSSGMFIGSRISAVSVHTSVCVLSLRVRCSSFFRCRYGFHNFVQGEIYVLSFGVRRIGFCKFKRASRSMRLRFMLGVLLESCWLSFSTWFSYWFLDSFWVPFGAHLGPSMEPQFDPKTVRKGSWKRHRKKH